MLKENWTGIDKLSYSDFNTIITHLTNICTNLAIQMPKLQYRKIRVGDDLSGVTIYMEYDGIAAYNSLPSQNYRNIIIETANNHIRESVYGSYSEWYKTLCTEDNQYLFKYYYFDYMAGKYPETNLKEFKLPDNFGVVTNIDENSYFYQRIRIKTHEIETKTRGSFLYANELKEVDDTLQEVCSQLLLDYEHKNWYDLSIISYRDINRWCKAINKIETLERNKYQDITGKYEDLTDETYRQLLYKEV